LYTNFVAAIDRSNKFSKITFFCDGFGDHYLAVGGTIRFAAVPVLPTLQPTMKPTYSSTYICNGTCLILVIVFTIVALVLLCVGLLYGFRRRFFTKNRLHPDVFPPPILPNSSFVAPFSMEPIIDPEE
jgi:hypothetical protein